MRTPAVDRRVLGILAGLVWSVVGLVLSGMAACWFWVADGDIIIPLIIGICGSLIIYRGGFLRVARTNMARIYRQAPGKEKVCLFAFQNWRSYIIVAVMIAAGYTLRHSSLPKIYLAPVYLAIGMGLFLASLHYYAERIS